MKLRDILDEFELDWAQAASRIKQYPCYAMLDGAEIVVAGKGNDVTRAVAYSMLALNDALKTGPKGVHVTLLSPEPKLFPTEFISQREDLTVASLDDCTVKTADYVVYTGMCNQKIGDDIAQWTQEIAFADKVLRTLSAISMRRMILLSDYRAYGYSDTAMVMSEYEQLPPKEGLLNLPDTALIRSIEALCSAYAKQHGFVRTILRSAILIGARIMCQEDVLTRILTAVLKGEPLELCRSRYKSSYIYINDLLTALLYAMEGAPAGKVYNAAGNQATVSTGELTELLYHAFPNQADIRLKSPQDGQAPEIRAAAISDAKLRYYGWAPAVTMEDLLILKIKSMQEDGGTFIFNDTYEGKLTCVQQILLSFLLEIDRICKKHGIQYFLAGGTLLVAIRHGGFIPWDDDADVMMLREDYDKFCRVVQSELPENLFFQTPWTERRNHGVFAKIRINDTIFATKFTSRLLDMHNGIFFDVLCHDQTANHPLAQKLHIFATIMSRSLVFHKWGNTPIKTGGTHPYLCKAGTVLKRILPMPFLEWMQRRCLTLFARSKKSAYLYDGMGRNIRRGTFPKEWLGEAILVDFEGYRFPVPKEYDKYLTYLYGDYMQMIPVSERRTSHAIVLMDLGEYSGFRLSDE